METKDRQKLYIIILASIVGLIIAYSVIYQPLRGAWDANDKKIKALKAEVDHDKLLIDNQAKIEAKWERWKSNALPGNTSLAGSAILTHKEGWTQTSGVTPGTFQPQIKSDEDPDTHEIISTMECRADAEGNMRALLSFLQAIENDPLGLKLEEVDFSSKDNYGQDLTLGLNMSALILDMPQPTSP